MTELLLICSIGVLGVAFATTVARWLLARPVGDAELDHTAQLVGAGVARYLRRQTVVSLSAAAVVAAALFLAYGVAYQTLSAPPADPASLPPVGVVTFVSPREHGVWLTVSYLLGAGFGVLASWVASWAGRHASARVAEGARRSLDDSLQIAIRAGAVSGVVSQALSLIGLAGLFGAVYLYFGYTSTGAFSAAAPAALAIAPRIPLLLVGFALGAAFVSLLAQLGGGVFGAVADVGADVAGKLEGELPEDAAQNPAAIADLVGDNVGGATTRAASLFAAAVAESLAAMLVAAFVYRHNEALPSVTALVLFPLVARTFSLLAAWFGVMVVRTDDTELPMSALARGLYVTTLLYAVGAVGCAKWLLGAHWRAFGACAVLGSLCSLVILFVVQYYSEQRYRPVRAVADAARGGPTLVVLRGLVTSVEGSAALIIAIAGTALLAQRIGASSGLVGGGLFGITIAVGGMLGSAPYVLSMDGMGSSADTAGGLIEMTFAADRPDVRARVRLLDAVGTTVKGFTESLATACSSLACFVLLAVFIQEVWEGSGGASASPPWGAPSSPMWGPVLVGGLLGLLLVLAFGCLVLWRVVGAARDLVNELRVQLGADEDGVKVRLGASSGPLDRERSKAGEASPFKGLTGGSSDSEQAELVCVEMVSRIALRGMLPPALLGVGLPLCIGVVLRLLASDDKVTSSAEALVALLVVATIAGALGSLLFTNAGSAWDNAKKYIETGAHGGRYVAGANNPIYVAAVVGDTIGDPLKGAVGPATRALLHTLTALALAFLPFFL